MTPVIRIAPLSLILSFICGTSALTQTRQITVSGHRFTVHVQGLETRTPGSPVVVFENGLGVGLGHWDTILDSIGKLAPVFAYDRAGVEDSDKQFRMPTPAVVAQDLHAILNALNIPPPYILVGHSLGGVYIRGFAGIFTEEVRALIFIDPADFTETKQDWRNLLLDLGVSNTRVDEMIQERLYKKTAVDSARYGPWSESEVLTALRRADFTALNSLPMPSVPIVFLVGGKFEVPRERWSKDFEQHQFFLKKTDLNIQHWRRIIDSSPKGSQLIYLPECGHFVHRDNSGAVIGVIRKIITQ